MNLPLSSLVSEGNVRVKSVTKTEEYKQLKANIKQIGIKTPITYRVNEKGENVIINGHQRVSIAKSLGFKEIPAYEMNGVDDTTAQLATNLFTVPLNHLDGAKAIMDLYKNGVVPGRKTLKVLFGKNNDWVKAALALNNVSPFIIDYIEKNEDGNVTGCVNDLEIISKSSIQSQEIALFELLEHDFSDSMSHNTLVQKEVNDAINNYKWSDHFNEFMNDLAHKLCDSDTKFKEICDTVGEDVFREYEKEQDVQYEYQDGLFAEFNEKQWCQDENFLLDLYLNKTEIGQYLLELPIMDSHECYDISDDYCAFDFAKSLTSFKRQIAKDTGISFANCELVGWNGNIYSPKIGVNLPESDKTNKTSSSSEEAPKDPFALVYNKLNKVVAPVAVEYMRDEVVKEVEQTGEHGLYKTMSWLLGSVTPRLTLYAENLGHHYDNAEVLRTSIYRWYEQYYPEASFYQCNQLCKLLALSSLEEIVAERWKTDKEFRTNYLLCFSVDVLKDGFIQAGLSASVSNVKGTKAELANQLAESQKVIDNGPVRADLCMTNEGSGPNNIASYLSDTSILYEDEE